MKKCTAGDGRKVLFINTMNYCVIYYRQYKHVTVMCAIIIMDVYRQYSGGGHR